MVKKIDKDNVEQYIRNNMEPVSYSDLISVFSQPNANENMRKTAKLQLDNILHSSINAGAIVHYQEHFISKYLPQDVEVVLNSMDDDEELASEFSSISFSSSESLKKVKTTTNLEELKK
ncbi:hypothetical protein KR222_002163 [Zaprionus bogoriensis]|nr:hypothetical protein KR222_002163 [Zaprionus bogoriensis]